MENSVFFVIVSQTITLLASFAAIITAIKTLKSLKNSKNEFCTNIALEFTVYYNNLISDRKESLDKKSKEGYIAYCKNMIGLQQMQFISWKKNHLDDSIMQVWIKFNIQFLPTDNFFSEESFKGVWDKLISEGYINATDGFANFLSFILKKNYEDAIRTKKFPIVFNGKV